MISSLEKLLDPFGLTLTICMKERLVQNQFVMLPFLIKQVRPCLFYIRIDLTQDPECGIFIGHVLGRFKFLKNKISCFLFPNAADIGQTQVFEASIRHIGMGDAQGTLYVYFTGHWELW